MDEEISENILVFVKEALPALLNGEKESFLKKPFNGFYLAFRRDPADGLIGKYTLAELGFPEKSQEVFLCCRHIFV